MKRIIIIVFSTFISYNIFSQTILFDADWRFHRGDIENGQAQDIDESTWRKIDVPHDFGIEDLPGTGSPFNPDALNGVSTGFTTGGTGWYRKSFTVPQQKNKKIGIQFDGVYMNADVWLNGKHLGSHPYGYTSFFYDITDKVTPGKNILAVQVENEGATSRWYSGSGIYRHVWLKITEPVHTAQWGVYIATHSVSSTTAAIKINTHVLNESDKSSHIKLITRIINDNGVVVGKTTSDQTMEGGSAYEFKQGVVVKSPVLWSIESPVLYTAVTEVYTGDKLSNRSETKFGIRIISFDAKQGFVLNDVPVKLKGGCFHIDNGPLGSKSFDRAEERRVSLLKASGFNAIRCSHNPPSPAFLDACDRLGMLVIDEAFDMWDIEKNARDYHLYFNDWWQRDLENMLIRDRNHPSVIMWSIGNEIPGMDDPRIATLAKTMADFVHKTEPTRPVTAAANSVSPKKDAFFSALDVAGYNYAKDNYEPDHQRLPERIIFCTESYPLQAFDYWMNVLDYPYVIGDFVWTGFDYIGEASIGWRGYPQEKNFYPWNLAFCGDIDICGWKRPQSFYRDALWKKDRLSVFVKPPQPSFELNPKIEPWSIWNWDDVVADWNWFTNENIMLEVNVYSSCDEAELFLNGKSFGKKPTNRSTKFMAKFMVPYASGNLKAIGYNSGNKITISELNTAGHPEKIKLSADRKHIKANGQDLSYITVELLDSNGYRNPKAENNIHFTVSGPGTIAGVGNANPVSVESYQQPQRKAWQGRCLVIIKSGRKAGDIVVTASSEGLQSNKIVLSSQ